jgi:hypothetical protein
MKTIYDEAIEEIKSCFYDGGEFPITIKVLERAKKEHELLELYRQQRKTMTFEKWHKRNNEIEKLEEELK